MIYCFHHKKLYLNDIDIRCKTKDEIIADGLNDTMRNNNEKLKVRNQGRYAAMFDLLHELEIYEKEET